MIVYVVKKTTYLVESNKVLGEENTIAKIFDDQKFADFYFNKYLNEPKVYSASKKVYWVFSKPEAMELTNEQIDELQNKDPYIQHYKKEQKSEQ